MARGMTDVDVTEAPGPREQRGTGDPTAARRAALTRVLRRVAPAVALVLAVVVGWQVVTTSRERAEADRHRATPGVIGTTVTPPLDATPWGSAAAGRLLRDGTPVGEDRLVGATPDAGGASRTVVLLDVATGSPVWRTTLPDGAGSAQPTIGSCVVGAVPAKRVWCTTALPDPDAGTMSDGLVGLDLATGAVVDRRDVPAGTTSLAVDDLLVTAAPAADAPDALLVTATPLSGGDPRWTRRLSPVVPVLDPGRALTRVGDHLLLQTVDEQWSLDIQDGRVEARGQQLERGRGDGLLDVLGSSTTRLLGSDGRGTAEAEGTPVLVHPDDGSAPGVEVLLRRDGTPTGALRAVDGVTGDVLWEEAGQHPLALFMVLLDGVLYGDDGDTVWARDVRTGEERWRTATGSAPVSTVMTDGVHLLRSEVDPDGDGVLLAAYDLDDGARAWTTPLTGGVRDLWTASWVPWTPLFGRTEDGAISTLR